MSLRRHVCRLENHIQKPGNHIWIGEDILDSAIRRFFHPRITRRHVGLAPGPLEARKRASKRRMMNLAQVGGGVQMDPSLLSGMGQTQEMGWQWQSPGTSDLREEKKPLQLPHWLVQPDTPKVGKNASRVRKDKDHLSQQPRVQAAVEANPIAHINYIEDLKDCKDLAAVYKWAANHKLELQKYSRPAFRQLYESGQALQVLLRVLDEEAFNTAGNLAYLFDRQISKPLTPDDLRILEQWLKRTFYLGQRSEAQISSIMNFVSRIPTSESDEDLRCRLASSILEGLLSSMVFGVRELKPGDIKSLLEAITQGNLSRGSQDLGSRVIEALRPGQARILTHEFALFLSKSISFQESREQGVHQGKNCSDVTSKIFGVLRNLPLRTCRDVIEQTSKAMIERAACLPKHNAPLLDTLTQWWFRIEKAELLKSGDQTADTRQLERLLTGKPLGVVVTYLQHLDDSAIARYLLQWEILGQSPIEVQTRAWSMCQQAYEAELGVSPFVSMLKVAHQESNVSKETMLRIFGLLQMLKKSQCVVDIIVGLRNANIEIGDSVVLQAMKAGLQCQHFRAEAIFSINRGIPLEKCPELAERMIKNVRRRPMEALKHYVARHPGVVTGCREPPHTIKVRSQLLERMSIAYSTAAHLTPRMAFSHVYKCYIYHMRETLGPPPVGMVQALTRSGIVLPLQRDEWVSTERVRWIMGLIRRIEGPEIADRVDEAVYKWRGIVVKKIQANIKRRRRARYGLKESPMSFSIRNCWNARHGHVDKVFSPLKSHSIDAQTPKIETLEAKSTRDQ